MNEPVNNQSSEPVTLQITGPIAVVALNRPEKRNAISDRVIAALGEKVDIANRTARVAVLHGVGRNFSAGLDLAEHVERSTTEGVANSRRWHQVFDAIENAPIPWISAIHGATVGGGLELVASTHLRVADASAFFALPEGQRGIFVGGGGSVRIVRLIGAARTIDMMLTGRVVSATDAEQWNLVQYLTENGKALDKAMDLAEQISTNSDFSNYAIVNTLTRTQDLSRADGLYLESMVSAIAAGTDDAKRRLADFLEKKAGKIERPEEH